MARFCPARRGLGAGRIDHAGDRHLLAAAALLGGATIILEISLTRLFSVLLFYHFVFLVLAVALLGLGLGGVIAAGLPDRIRRAEEHAASAAGLAALGAVVATLLSARALPAGIPLLHGAVAMLPFLAAGVAMPLLFASKPEESGRIYAADLAGAAAGAALAFALLYRGAITAALAAAALYALAAWSLGRRKVSGRAARTALLVAAAALFAVDAAFGLIDVDLGHLAAGKPLGNFLKHGQATVTASSWDPFARVDIVRSPLNPIERLVFVDGAAGSPLPHFPADANEARKRETELGSFPYRLVPAARALVVGSGGGIGVLYALLDGVKDVTAVEVSPGVVDAVRANGDFDGYLYDRPDVRVVTDEGRTFLERDAGRYDVIDLSLVVSLASAQSGYALTENYLFTEEGFASVYGHLSDNGVAAIRLYDDPTLTRAFMTAATAVRRSEPNDQAAVRHLAVLFNPAEATRGTPAFYPMLLVSKRPLTAEAAKDLVARADKLNFNVLYAPFAKEDGPLGKVASGQASLSGIQAELTGGVFTPPTDARPFFFEMTGGLPRQLIDAWIAVAAIVLLTAAGVLLMRRRGGPATVPAREIGPGLAYFALLGVAFMLVELALLVRLSLVLGQPTVALTVTLGGLLVAGGLGSLLSQRIAAARLAPAVSGSAVVAALLGVTIPAVAASRFHTLATLAPAARVALTLLAILPLGLAMGVLFPSGLRLASGDATLPWAVNGVASVVGSVLATTLAIRFGYPLVSYAGGLLYGLLAIVGPFLLRRPRALPSPRWRRSGEALRNEPGTNA